MGDDVGTLKQAIVALYSPTSTEKARSDANAWLMQFAASPAAWQAARALLAEADEQVQYFGANLLFMKVRSEWHSLPEDAKLQIYGVVKELVSKITAAAQPGWMRLNAGSKRLCLVLAAAAVRSNLIESFTNDALEIASDPSGKGAAVAVELLIALPQELLERSTAQAQAPAVVPAAPQLKRVGSGEGSMMEGRPELRALLPRVLQLLVAALGAFGAGSGSEHAECATACVRCLQQWLSLEVHATRATPASARTRTRAAPPRVASLRRRRRRPLRSPCTPSPALRACSPDRWHWRRLSCCPLQI